MEKLTDKARIDGLLKRVFEKRTLLTVNIEGHPQQYSSAIIEISTDEGVLVFDELKPESGHAFLQKTPTFKAHAQLEGISINFKATIIEFGEDNEIPFYKTKIPSSISYLQRRQAVRIKLSAAHPMPVNLTTDDGKKFKGEISDLSSGGMRVRFDKDIPNSIEAGVHLGCTFPLPPDNKENFACDFIVRVNSNKSEPHKPAFLGGQFIDLKKPQERQLQRLIMTLQRILQQNRGD
jgi:c-di-GMP-binding flagellar brake protein YcgR